MRWRIGWDQGLKIFKNCLRSRLDETKGITSSVRFYKKKAFMKAFMKCSISLNVGKSMNNFKRIPVWWQLILFFHIFIFQSKKSWVKSTIFYFLHFVVFIRFGFVYIETFNRSSNLSLVKVCFFNFAIFLSLKNFKKRAF